MSDKSTQQGFPNTSLPFVDSRGVIQQAWLQLLITLFTRTGGGSGVSSDDLNLIDGLLSSRPLPDSTIQAPTYTPSPPVPDQPVQFPVPLQIPTEDLADAILIALTFLRPITTMSSLGLGSAALEDIGTSGGTVPLLNAANTWSAVQSVLGLITQPETFATLPTAVDGLRSFITDGSLPLLANAGAAAAGGGTNHVPVYYDGGSSAWRLG